jgi:head-tail adaptor
MAHIPHGMMRLQVVPKNPTQAVDALGQDTETFAVISGLAALPAYIEQMETAESIDDGGPAVQTRYRLMVPWHPDVTTRTRLEWVDNGTTRILNVRSCTDRDQRRRTLEIEAMEVTT